MRLANIAACAALIELRDSATAAVVSVRRIAVALGTARVEVAEEPKPVTTAKLRSLHRKQALHDAALGGGTALAEITTAIGLVRHPSLHAAAPPTAGMCFPFIGD